VQLLTDPGVDAAERRDTASVAVHSMLLTDSTFAQYRSELRRTPDPVDWLGVVWLVNEVVRGGQVLRRTHGTAGRLPWPRVATDLEHLAGGIADQLREISGLVSRNGRQSPAATVSSDVTVDTWISTSSAQEVVRRQADPVSAVRVLDIWGWLEGVSFNSRTVSDAVRRAIQPR